MGKRKAVEEAAPAPKLSRKANKVKLTLPTALTGPGKLLVCGQGDVGQLGLGEDVPEKTRPALVDAVKNVIDVQAGGMHSVCLTDKGEIYTFGCNDEGALGRDTSKEGSEYEPGSVTLPKPVLRVTCGDSHTACLLDDGRVFAWGSFRDSHGNMGLTLEGNKREPIQLLSGHTCVSIASGADHLVILTDAGLVFTVGCAEQGQLGRVSSRSAGGESRRGKNPLLQPEQVPIRFKVDRIWATSFSTFVRENGTSKIHAFGLNNYSQLGIAQTADTQFTARKTNFEDVSDLAGGSHHVIIRKSDHKCYAIGRRDYGRLGLGDTGGTDTATELTLIPALADKKIVQISCGECTSFALTDAGEVYAFGMGTNSALGTGNEEDCTTPTLLQGAQVKEKQVVRVAGGAQHSMFVVRERDVNKGGDEVAVATKNETVAKTNGKAPTKQQTKANAKKKAVTKETTTNGQEVAVAAES